MTEHLIQLLGVDYPLVGLDVGCGRGEIISQIHRRCPRVNIHGIDVVKRENTVVDVLEFDGKKIPFEDKSHDFTMLVDVLHHVDEPLVLLKECVRVTRKFIIIKDHICNSGWDRARLSLMDWVGNQGYKANFPHNYLSQTQWDNAFNICHIKKEREITDLKLYPKFFHYLFEDNLHFISKFVIL